MSRAQDVYTDRCQLFTPTLAPLGPKSLCALTSHKRAGPWSALWNRKCGLHSTLRAGALGPASWLLVASKAGSVARGAHRLFKGILPSSRCLSPMRQATDSGPLPAQPLIQLLGIWPWGAILDPGRVINPCTLPMFGAVFTSELQRAGHHQGDRRNTAPRRLGPASVLVQGCRWDWSKITLIAPKLVVPHCLGGGEGTHLLAPGCYRPCLGSLGPDPPR